VRTGPPPLIIFNAPYHQNFRDLAFKRLDMKKILFSTFVLAAVSLLSFTNFSELPIGSEMPKADVKMKDISGKEVTLKDAVKKNGLLVMFTCNTCPYVIKNQERTKEICKYASDNNIGVVLINSNEGQRSDDDSFDAMKAYAKHQDYKWYYTVDTKSELADAFGAKRTPEVFLFNKENKLVYHGAIDDNPSDAGSVSRKHLKEAISEVLNGKDVTVKTSKSVGCGIKRL
jgi:thioredoxin-related protein